MSFARWRHFITARGSGCGYPRAVLSFEQGWIIFQVISEDDDHGKNTLKENCRKSVAGDM